MAILEFNDVTFTYPADPDAPKDTPAPRPVLNHLNLQIEKGAFVAVLGHNGSGKSTLAKLSNGILFPQMRASNRRRHAADARRRCGL